jgi:hypothetical protein
VRSASPELPEFPSPELPESPLPELVESASTAELVELSSTGELIGSSATGLAGTAPMTPSPLRSTSSSISVAISSSVVT